MVPEVGLEPTRRADPRGILSPVRLPIPPLRHQSVERPYIEADSLYGGSVSYHTLIFIQGQDGVLAQVPVRV